MFSLLLATVLLVTPADEGVTNEESRIEVCDARAENPDGDTAVTCCCSTRGGGICCAETTYCSGGFVPGCMCSR